MNTNNNSSSTFEPHDFFVSELLEPSASISVAVIDQQRREAVEWIKALAATSNRNKDMLGRVMASLREEQQRSAMLQQKLEQAIDMLTVETSPNATSIEAIAFADVSRFIDDSQHLLAPN